MLLLSGVMNYYKLCLTYAMEYTTFRPNSKPASIGSRERPGVEATFSSKIHRQNIFDWMVGGGRGGGGIYTCPLYGTIRTAFCQTKVYRRMQLNMIFPFEDRPNYSSYNR